MKMIDLTHVINNETQVCPCDKQPSIDVYASIDREGVNVKMLTFGTHTGTHLDAPYHTIKDGKTINEFDIERFVNRGVLLDFSDKGARYEINYEDIMVHKCKIEKGDFVILNTGWAKYFGTSNFFNHPYLGEGGAKALVELGVSLVGTDGSSVDAAYGFAEAIKDDSKSFEEVLSSISGENVAEIAHEIILGSEMLIVEYLCNLDKIDQEIGYYSFLPLKIEKSDGSPIRAVFFSTDLCI